MGLSVFRVLILEAYLQCDLKDTAKRTMRGVSSFLTRLHVFWSLFCFSLRDHPKLGYSQSSQNSKPRIFKTVNFAVCHTCL